MFEGLGISKCSSGGGVVEDAPRLGDLTLVCNCGGERLQECSCVPGVIHARRTVEAVVDELIPTTGDGSFRYWRRVGCDSGDVELLQELVCFGSEPSGMAGLEEDGA